MINKIIIGGSNKKINGFFYQSKKFNSIIVVIVYSSPENVEIPKCVNDVVLLLQSFNFNVFLFNLKAYSDSSNEKKKNKNKKNVSPELLDLISILTWIHKNYTEENRIWIFSFFQLCLYAVELVMRRPEISNFILFSPNIKTVEEKEELNKLLVPSLKVI